MNTEFNQNIANEFYEKLKPTADKVRKYNKNQGSKPTNTEISAAVKVVNEYYQYLIDCDVKYGKIAYDAANNKGSFGGYANNYFKYQAKAEGKSDKQIEDITPQLKILLANDDSRFRADYPEDSKGHIKYSTIADYHYNNLKVFQLSKKAWGGTLFEEHAGSGSWMDIGGYNTDIDVDQGRLFKALLFNEKVGGVGAREYASIIMKSGVSWGNLGNSAGAVLYRSVIVLEEPETKEFFADYLAYADLMGHPIYPEGFVKHNKQAEIKQNVQSNSFLKAQLYNSVFNAEKDDKFVGKQTYDLNNIPKLFGNLNHYTSSGYKPFASDIINNFVVGKYSNFNQMELNLFKPFNSWKMEPLFNELDQQLASLKRLALDIKFNTYSDNLEKVPTYSSDSGWQQSKASYVPYINNNKWQGKLFNYNYEKVYNSALKSYGGYWSQTYYNRGTGLKYNANGFSFEIGVSRPIAISLKGSDISFIKYLNSAIFFDLDEDGYLENTAWVGANGAILAYDYNGDKQINLAREIVFTAWDLSANTDMEALKNQFDSNKDNRIDKQDKEFEKFYLWQDLNQDGIAQSNELKTLNEAGILEISLILNKASTALEEYGVTNTAEVKWQNNLKTTAYDMYFEHSKYGMRATLEDNTIVINYKVGDNYKVFSPSSTEEAVMINTDKHEFDVILGSNKGDNIVLQGSQGVLVDAGTGDDTINIKGGNNWVKGGLGKDNITTGDGHDILFIDHEDQIIDAGTGFDVAFVTSEVGINIDLAKTNIEAIYGNKGNDVIKAENSKSGVQIYGGEGNDKIIGSKFADIIDGGGGIDEIKAGDGDDSIFIDSEADLKQLDAGEGDDSVFLLSELGINVNLDAINAENFFGNRGNDKITASGNKKYILSGGEGNDELSGGTFLNVLDGGKGNDILKGGKGSNKYVFKLQSGNDVIYPAGRGRDNLQDLVLLSSQIKLEEINFEKLNNDLILSLRDGSSLKFPNWFLGDQYKVDAFIFNSDDETNNKQILLYDKEPTLMLNSGKDWVVFTVGEGHKSLEGSAANEFFKTGKGNDIVIGWGGNDIAYSGDGNDILVVWDKADFETCKQGVKFFSEAGNDIIVGAGGDDLLDGGIGVDYLYGRGGNDIIYTGDDRGVDLSKGISDYVEGGDGNDTINLQGAGVKQIYGNKGNDKFIVSPDSHDTHTIYAICDYEINNKNEIIDFSQINHVHSLDDLHIFGTEIEIDFSFNKQNEVLKARANEHEGPKPAVAMCWNTADQHYKCLYLVDHSVEQVLQSSENYLFA